MQCYKANTTDTDHRANRSYKCIKHIGNRNRKKRPTPPPTSPSLNHPIISTARGGNDSIQNCGILIRSNVNSETDENPVTFLLSPGWTVQCSETPLVTRFFCNALTASGFHSQAWTCRALACTRYGRVKYPIPDKVTVKTVTCQHLIHHATFDQGSNILHYFRFLLFITFWCLSKNKNNKKK